MRPRELSPLIAILLLAFSGEPLSADTIRVAAASNFRNTLEEIAEHFERQSGHDVVLIFGSTGKHYAQLVNGAPYDLFFAADTERPQKLEERGLSLAGKRYTYAIGRLALWSPRDSAPAPEDRLASGDYRYLAIANPALAPYGRAAEETLRSLGLWQDVSGRVVTGENIGQTYQFVFSGNADLGFVARSQLLREDREPTGSWWLVPESMHRPIAQDAVQLRDGDAAGEFFEFARGSRAVEIIRAHGYSVPDDR